MASPDRQPPSAAVVYRVSASEKPIPPRKRAVRRLKNAAVGAAGSGVASGAITAMMNPKSARGLASLQAGGAGVILGGLIGGARPVPRKTKEYRFEPVTKSVTEPTSPKVPGLPGAARNTVRRMRSTIPRPAGTRRIHGLTQPDVEGRYSRAFL